MQKKLCCANILPKNWLNLLSNYFDFWFNFLFLIHQRVFVLVVFSIFSIGNVIPLSLLNTCNHLKLDISLQVMCYSKINVS